MATKPKGVKPIAVEEVKVKTSSVDNTETHDTANAAAKLRKEKTARKDPSKYISHHNSGSTSNKVVIKKDGLFAYINRTHADRLVASNTGYSYGKKSEWKTNVRDAKEPKLLTVPPVSKRTV
jgi:hypothetical protein